MGSSFAVLVPQPRYGFPILCVSREGSSNAFPPAHREESALGLAPVSGSACPLKLRCSAAENSFLFLPLACLCWPAKEWACSILMGNDVLNEPLALLSGQSEHPEPVCLPALTSQ